jgi:uncharacterized membrane protein
MEIVDDEYWLGYAKKTIENSITSRNDAASKLESMTLWFWGLYTATFTIGVSINAIEAPFWVLIIMALPIISLIITYWFCVLAQFPVTTEFDPTIPYEIKEGYNQGVFKKKKRFNWALTFTFISAVLLSSSLFSLSFFNKKIDTAIEAQYDKESNSIIISGLLPKAVTAQTTLDSVQNNKKVSFYSNKFIIPNNGIINLNVKVSKLPQKTILNIYWTDKNKQYGFARIIKK